MNLNSGYFFLSSLLPCTPFLTVVMYIQLDVASSQLLVTDNDFKDPEFRQQLSETVNSLLALRVVPIFNENDAISTRKSPYFVRISLHFLNGTAKFSLNVLLLESSNECMGCLSAYSPLC